jgi:hypothetical protein
VPQLTAGTVPRRTDLPSLPLRRDAVLASISWLIAAVVHEDGVTVRELERLARTRTNLAGMLRWGYIVPSQLRPPAVRARSVLTWCYGLPTGDGGRRRCGGLCSTRSSSVGTPVSAPAAVEGSPAIDPRGGRPARRSPAECLPILGYGLSTKDWLLVDADQLGDRASGSADSEFRLAALLARVLLAYAIEFERATALSLALCANVVRVLDETPVRVRDLPTVEWRLGGMSMGVGVLSKEGWPSSMRSQVDD